VIEKNILPPDVLLEDGAVFVMNKPGGLLTQGPPGIDSLELRTKHFLKVRDEKPGKVYLGVPHRLDRPVSGAITVVKNVRAAQRLSQQIREHRVTKTYWAVVAGSSPDDSGRWTDFMRKIPDEARSEIVQPDHPDAKEAVLDFRVIASDDDRSLIEIQLVTGRTHQIRLQCSHRGLPILGDAMYGSESAFGPQTTDLRKRWIALHARRLAFEHPINGHPPVDQTAPLPECWQSVAHLTEQA
jgi:RluA family pseudouridine synthase